ncbi:MAG: MmcQ/YjbR family DNA-binding protein [Gemmatimonadota bacterium]
MPAKVTWETVRELALALPDVEEATSWGAPAFKRKGKMFTCRPTHKSAEPDSLVVLLDFMERDLLLRVAPETYYLKPHYQNYPCVLVRLGNIRKTALRELLVDSHDYVKHKRKR